MVVEGGEGWLLAGAVSSGMCYVLCLIQFPSFDFIMAISPQLRLVHHFPEKTVGLPSKGSFGGMACRGAIIDGHQAVIFFWLLPTTALLRL